MLRCLLPAASCFLPSVPEMPSVGVLTLELRLDGAHSLKDKRHTVKSLKDRLRSKFNVAVAEIEYQDLWQRSLISAVTVSGDHGHAAQVLQLVEREAASLLGGVLIGATVEWIE
jgi:uncharacterized protein